MTVTSASPEIKIELHKSPVSDADRVQALEAPGFGKLFTDHMVLARWTAEKGWHDAKVTPRRPLELDPASAVLHYAQEIFEGMKAYKADDGR
ncbi:branched chain amino acid aminotransferase, partial [Rhizobium phaseoli]